MIAIILFASLGCAKDSGTVNVDHPPIPFLSMLEDVDTIDNYIVINNNQMLNTYETNNVFTTFFAAFRNGSNTAALNAGRITVDGLSTAANVRNTYTYNYRDSGKTVNANALYGKTFSVSVAGSSTVSAFTTSVYMPKKMMDYQFIKSTHNGTQAFTLNWTPDSAAPLNKVYIILERLNSTGLSTDVRSVIVDDTGTYSLPALYFGGNWVSGTAFTIHLGRLTETIVNVGGRKVFVYAVFMASTGVIKIQ